MTTTEQNSVGFSASSQEQFLNLWASGQIENLPFMPCRSEDLYDCYRCWLTRSGGERPSMLHVFIAFIDNQTRVMKRRERYRILGGFDQEKIIVFPLGMTEPPENITRSIWIGNCVTDFRTKKQTFLRG